MPFVSFYAEAKCRVTRKPKKDGRKNKPPCTCCSEAFNLNLITMPFCTDKAKSKLYLRWYPCKTDLKAGVIMDTKQRP